MIEEAAKNAARKVFEDACGKSRRSEMLIVAQTLVDMLTAMGMDDAAQTLNAEFWKRHG